jgi:hypothetical protein
MPEVKECQALYDSIFEAETRGEAGEAAAASICSKVSSMQADLPPAPTDGTKAARQPDQPLETLQREGALPLFQLLRRRYAPALSRAGFAPLLDVVAFHFYAVPMPQQAQSTNPMMAMMQRMMSGGN